MPILEKLSKHRHEPKAVIFRGACKLGVELANLLIEQGAYVIVIDEYSKDKKRKVLSLLENELFSFVDVSGTASLADSIEKLDYIFYFNHDVDDPDEEVSTSDFLERSNSLDRLLRLGVEKNSKFLLTTSIQIHRILQTRQTAPLDMDLGEDLSYTALEVQRYAENLTWEYFKKSGLDARIIRISEVLGEGVDLDKDSIVIRFIKKAINGEKVEVEGDGLEKLYFVHVLDAAYGLVKAQFTPKTSGKIYSLVIPQDITVLNLAYKILDLEPRAAGIDFVDKKGQVGIEVYKPAPNLKKIGWKPKVSFERSLAQTISFAYKAYGKQQTVEDLEKKKDVQKKEDIVKMEEKKKRKKKRSIKDFLFNFFFEVKEEKQARSVLDSVQFGSYGHKALKKEDERDLSDRVHLTDKRKEKSKYRRSKLKVISWKFLDLFTWFKKTLKSLTVVSLLKYFGVFFFATLVYIFFFVPVLRIVYYGGVAYIRLNSAVMALDDWKFSKASADLNRASSSVDQVNKNFDKLSYLSFCNMYKDVEELQTRLGDISRVLEGSRNITQNLESIEAYLNNYNSNVELDGVDDLKANEGASYNLSTLEGVKPDIIRAEQFLSLSIGPMSSNIRLPLVDKWIQSLDTRVETIRTHAQSASDILSIVPSVLAVDKSQTTAVLLLDESNMNTRGGEVTTVCVFTIDGGQVIDIRVYSSSEIDLNLSFEQDRFVRDDLKLLYPEKGMTFEDITLLTNDTNFETLVKSAIESKFGTAPDHIVTMNLAAAGDLIALFGGVDLSSGKVLNSTNYEEEIVNRDNSKKEILAKIFYRLYSFSKTDLIAISTWFEQNLEDKDVQLYTGDLDIKEFLIEHEIMVQDITGEYNEMKVGLISNMQFYPDIYIENKVDFSPESLEAEYLIKFVADLEQETSGVAFIMFEDNFEVLEVNNTSAGFTAASSYADRVFLNYDLEAGSEESIVIKGRNHNVVSSDGISYNYNLLARKPSGFSYNYSIIIDYGDALELVSFPDRGITQDTTVRLDEKIEKDELWEFKFRNSQ